MKRVLAIDYGDVRVGLAVSDELNITAQGIETLEIKGNLKLFYQSIIDLIIKYDIGIVVIGYPKNMNGSISDKAIIVDKIVEKLRNKLSHTDIDIIKWDERLSTVSAYSTMRELDIKQKEKNKHADRLAATYILEGYMNSIKR